MMFFISVFAALAGGGAMAFLLWRSRHDKRITKVEFTVVSVIVIPLLVIGVGWIGGVIARNSALTYEEFWDGSITKAESKEYTCERDGDCVQTYDCDPYEVWELVGYKDVPYIDANGDEQTRQEPVYDWVTHWHECPYATHEYSYWLEDSFKRTHPVATHGFAANPQPWRGDRNLPDVQRGAPQEWLEAQASIAAGDLPDTTMLVEYTNYFLAAQASLLAAYSDSIEEYQEAGLIAYHTANLTTNPLPNGYQADKVVFAGVTVSNYDEWQRSIGRLNAQIGTVVRGDLHVIVAPASRITDPVDYTNALLAYNQSRELGRRGLAKNAILLVIGASADGQTVEWAMAKTGIPEGNSGMLDVLSRRLAGQPMEPRTLLGWPRAQYVNDELVFTPSGGIVEQVVIHEHPFQRPCMDCEDDDDVGSGYVYLKSSAYISTRAQVSIGFVLFFLSMGAYGVVGWVDFGQLQRAISAARSNYRSNRHW